MLHHRKRYFHFAYAGNMSNAPYGNIKHAFSLAHWEWNDHSHLFILFLLHDYIMVRIHKTKDVQFRVEVMDGV